MEVVEVAVVAVEGPAVVTMEDHVEEVVVAVAAVREKPGGPVEDMMGNQPRGMTRGPVKEVAAVAAAAVAGRVEDPVAVTMEDHVEEVVVVVAAVEDRVEDRVAVMMEDHAAVTMEDHAVVKMEDHVEEVVVAVVVVAAVAGRVEDPVTARL